jgi:hypothetical protein
VHVLLGWLTVAALVLPHACASTIGPEVVPSSVSHLRELFLNGEVEAARLKVDARLAVNANDAPLLALQGDIAFRQARFSDAEQSYRLAVNSDGQCARGHWGLGRLELIASHTAVARGHVARAFQLDPRDRDIVLAYADLVPDLRSRLVLLRNFVSLAGRTEAEPTRTEDVVARLQILERLGRLDLGRVVSPYSTYQFKLMGYVPDGRNQSGLLVAVRLNGGKPLRLILDSGADGIFVARADARAAGVERLTADHVAGAGSASRDDDYVGLARNVSIGKLELEDSLIHVTGTKLFPGADGAIGMNVFEKFLLRVDPASLVLDLAPLPDNPTADMIPTWRAGHLLLVHDAANGYFMLDSGASFSAASGAPDSGPTIDIRGAQGRVPAIQSRPMRLKIEGRQLIDEKPIKLDLSELSRHAGVEISGIIGYPLLSRSALIINYRDGLVRFGQPGH